MAIVTPETYFNNELLHGNYQYISLKDIIDSILIESNEDDSIIKNTKRSTMLMYCKMAIKLVNRQASNDVLAIEFDVPDDLVFTLPQDFVSYVKVYESRISNSSKGYELFELDYSNKSSIAIGYLQDDQANILFDSNGNIITDDATNVYAKGFNSYNVEMGVNTPSVVAVNGEFLIDERRGKIIFEHKLAKKHIVLTYVSDGLQEQLTESEITVHKNVEEAIRDFVIYKCVQYKRNVNQGEKQSLLQRHKSTLHKAKLAMMDFNMRAVRRALLP